jgi:hypothetical protein
MPGRGILAGLVVIAIAGACATAASAAELSKHCGGREGFCSLDYHADPGEVNDLTASTDSATGEIVFQDPGATMRVAPFTPCRIEGGEARCTPLDGTGVSLSDGNDRAVSRILGAIFISGGYGNDTLIGSPLGRESMSGFDGDDTILTVDGLSDSINCGTGTKDVAVVDPLLDAFSDRCEFEVGRVPDPNELFP